MRLSVYESKKGEDIDLYIEPEDRDDLYAKKIEFQKIDDVVSFYQERF